MKRILIIIDYNQSYLEPFVQILHEEAEVFLINFAYENEVKSDYFLRFGKFIFWKDFRNAQDLIEKIKPNKVIFFELETLNQVALNVVCKKKKIQTVFCDHGLQDIRVNEQHESISHSNHSNLKLFKIRKHLNNNPINVWKNRRFFTSTINNLNDPEPREFLVHYKKIRLKNSIHSTYIKINNQFLYPNEYYCFSPKNYKFHEFLNHKSNIPVRFFGIPEFDYLAGLQKKNTSEYLIYIDQPFCQKRLYGWDQETKIKWISDLSLLCERKGMTLYIKKHPKELDSLWKEIKRKNENIILDNSDFTKFLSRSNCILGFNSTLLLPLSALPRTAVFCIQKHPDNTENIIDFFVNEGVAGWVKNFEDLSSKIDKLDENILYQGGYKDQFISNWLYRFDGNSSQRLKDLYLS